MNDTERESFLRKHLESFERDSKHYPYALPASAQEFESLSGLRYAVSASGSFFFSKGAMRFFHSRVESSFYARRFFITSEQHENEPRHYRVRWAYKAPSSDVLQVGALDTYFESLTDAREAAQTLASV